MMGPIQQVACAVSLAVLALPAGLSAQEKKAKPERQATVTDRKGNSIRIEDPRCVHLKKSIFGDSEDVVRHFLVHHGEGTIKVAFGLVKTFSVTKAEGEWVQVEIEYWKAQAGEPKTKKYRMKSADVLIRGDSAEGEYEISLVSVKTIAFDQKGGQPRSGD